MLATSTPYPQYFDFDGRPLDNGYLYFGAVGQNPETNPITVYWDAAGTQPAAQPIRTLNGYAMRGGSPAVVYCDVDHSLQARNRRKMVVHYNASAAAFANDLALQIQITDFRTSGNAAKGAALIPFTPTLGYPAGSLGAWLRQELNVFWFIPPTEHAAISAGTSTYDATADITAAFTWAAALAPVRLVFPTGKYKNTAGWGAFTASDIVCEFNGSKLDFSAAPVSTSCLQFNGTIGAYVNLSANGVLGARSVSVASTAGFAVDDYVKIVSSTIWDASNTICKIGEINRIQDGYTSYIGDELTGTVIPLCTELQSDYTTAATAKIAKITPVQNLIFRNGHFIGPNAVENLSDGIVVRYGVGVLMQNMRFERFDNSGAFFRNTIQVTVEGKCRFTKARTTNTGYGVVFGDASSDCVVQGCHFDDVRHAMTTNNTASTDFGITRRISFLGNTIRNSARSSGGSGGDAIDTHGGADYITISGNTVIGSSSIGINVECPNCVVTNNTVKDCVTYGIHVHNEADGNGSAIVSKNEVERTGGAGVYVISSTRGAASVYRSLSIKGNVVKNSGLTSPTLAENAGIVVKTYDDTKMNRSVSVMGNTVYTANGDGLKVSGVRNGSIGGNTVNDFTDYGLLLEDLISVAVTGNSVNARSGTAFPGVYMRKRAGSTACQRNTITGNTIGLQAGASAAPMVQLTDDVTNTLVRTNVQQGFTGGIVLGAGAGNSTTSDNIL